MMAHNGDVDKVLECLSANGDLVSIRLGYGPKYFVPRVILYSVMPCPIIFNNAHRLHSKQSNIPEYEIVDKLDVWKLFLHWIIRRTPLPTNDVGRLVECWCVGHLYRIPEFQDAAMIRLLQILEEPGCHIEALHFLKPFRCILANEGGWFELTDLLFEELVKSVNESDVELDWSEFEKLSGYRGLFPGFLRTQRRFTKNKDSFFNRFTKRDGQASARWEDFLMDDGIKKGWKRDQKNGESIIGGKRRWGQVA